MLLEKRSGEQTMYDELTRESWSPPAQEWAAPQPMTQLAAPATVRLCRELAGMIDASGFTVVFATANGESHRFAAVFDSTFPGTSSLSRALLAPVARDFVDKTATATSPLWWCGEEAACFLDADARKWATEVANPLADAPMTGGSGIAFPVAQEHGGIGAVIFIGDDLALDEQTLCGIHAGCHALFAELAPQRPLSGVTAPAMSKREIECLRLTANGFTSDDIAASLGLSVHTANQYLTSSAQKLNAVNRIHAVAKALRAGLID